MNELPTAKEMRGVLSCNSPSWMWDKFKRMTPKEVFFWFGKYSDMYGEHGLTENCEYCEKVFKKYQKYLDAVQKNNRKALEKARKEVE